MDQAVRWQLQGCVGQPDNPTDYVWAKNSHATLLRICQRRLLFVREIKWSLWTGPWERFPLHFGGPGHVGQTPTLDRVK